MALTRFSLNIEAAKAPTSSTVSGLCCRSVNGSECLVAAHRVFPFELHI